MGDNMTNERIELGKMPAITIPHCGGDLVIRSWSDTAVSLKGAYEVEAQENGLHITSQSTLRLTIPDNCALDIIHVAGDLVLKKVTSDTSVGEVSGDAIFAGVGLVKIKAVHGDVSAKKIGGSFGLETVHGDLLVRQAQDVRADNVYGDCSIRYTAGDVQLGEVMGDVGLRAVDGDVNVGNGRRDANVRQIGGQVSLGDVNGDIRIYGPLGEGHHNFKADGDIILRWPENVPLNLIAAGNITLNRLAWDQVTEGDDTLTGQIGESKTNVSLTAAGRVSLKSAQVVDEKWGSWVDDDFNFALDFDIDGLGEHIMSQVNDRVARISADIETRFGPEFTEKFTQQAERAAAKAEKTAERALRRAEQKLRNLEQRERRRQHRRPRRPSAPPPPPKPRASKEEQLKILNMVEKGVISPDEANTLLKAMEG